MADRRKLQGEIDRCLKKVYEGVDTFDDIWEKVYSATNSNQKEKYETDLKKEIKKLQRLRDQIKIWLTSNDIKDKKPLQNARKIIETQMERFKVIERETKTKAYSKEGLGAAQKLDPAQKERDEITVWLTACIESLNIQVDKFESEIDKINFSLKKKKNDKDKLDRLDDLKVRHGKHKYHINQLEALLRMLDNGTVGVDQIKKVKDDVEYYRDCSQEPDFQENEFIYDDLNLEDLEEYLAKQQASYQQSQLDLKNAAAEEENSAVFSNTPTSTSSNSPSHSPSLGNHSSETSAFSKVNSLSEDSSFKITDRKSLSPDKNCSSPESSCASTTHASQVSQVTLQNHQSVINSEQSPLSVVTSTSATTNNHLSNSHENSWSSSSKDKLNDVNMKTFRSNNIIEPSSNSSEHLPNSSSHSWTNSNFCFDDEQSSNSDNNCSEYMSSSVVRRPIADVNKTVPAVNLQPEVKSYNSSVGVGTKSHSQMVEDSQPSLKALAEQTVLNSGMSNHNQILQFSNLQSSQSTHNISRNSTIELFSQTNLSSSSDMSPPTSSSEINIAHIFGEVPKTLSSKQAKYIEILDAAFKHMPIPMDSQKERHLGIGGSTTTPDYYPTYISNSNSMEFFQRLSTETLFFIFYFLQGTKAQYFAARALKTKSWRFHTMYMMWFQRHEEPKTITDEYEQGTYIYFDFEKWAQRKKEGFTFEYKYLEDRDLN